MRRLTENFSMYSDMSTRMSEFASANRKRASPRASSVLPTPVGPEKMKDPIGRLGSLSPARLRRMAREITAIASSWPTTGVRSEEHTSELQSQSNLVCRLLLEKKKKKT